MSRLGCCDTLVDAYLTGDEDQACSKLLSILRLRESNHGRNLELSRQSPVFREANDRSAALRSLAVLGQEALRQGERPSWSSDTQSVIPEARKAVAKVELQVLDAVERLFEQATGR